MIILRKANENETDNAVRLINEAKKFLKQQGIDQWQKGYPDIECIKNDIKNKKGYFLEEDILIGYLCIDFDGEPAYDTLNGEWKGNDKYAVVHRMAIDDAYRGKGAASTAFDLVQSLCRENGVHSIRVDTDEDNKIMQHIIHKNGFEFCGSICFDNSKKIDFEKLF